MKIANPLIAILACASFTLLGGCVAIAEQQASTSMEAEQMQPATYKSSTKEAYAAMEELPTDEPIQMLNLLRFNEKADYEAGSGFESKGWSGEQAYAEYSRHAGPIANRLGANPIYIGVPQLTLIGPQHENWDAAFIIEYSNVGGLLALIGDPEYQKHAFHRSAAVADSRLIRMTPPAE